MPPVIRYLRFTFIIVWSMTPLAVWSAEQAGHLLIVGGGLRPDNLAVWQRLIQYAGGKERARFGVLPTASMQATDAFQTKLILNRLGIPDSQVQVIDITPANAATQAESKLVAAQIRACTGVFIEGGDQTRVTRALIRADGTATPALVAMREAWQRGAVIGGSSAGAAVQCETMISVAGLPDDSIDEGMDALDFGLTTNRFQRGLFVSRGLEFFPSGIIDQHFNQYRGRLGRLARVTIETKVPFGFGIDENTALDVSPDGAIEVVGGGTVTIVDSREGKLQDGPLGCRLSGVRLSLLEDGDRFEPKNGLATPREGKLPIVRGQEEFNGNFLIPDIHGPHGGVDALRMGLADNTARKQRGIALKHQQHHAHGYRFTFHKTDATECYEGYINGLYSNTVLGVRLDIDPIVGTLEAPEQRLPRDLPESGPARTRLSALFFRGILLADDERRLRPEAEITRAEFAGALAQTLRMEPPRSGVPTIADIDEEAPFAHDISLVVGTKLMELDGDRKFQPSKLVAQAEGSRVLAQLAARYRTGRPATESVDLEITTVAARNPHWTRDMVASALYEIISFPWDTKPGEAEAR